MVSPVPCGAWPSGKATGFGPVIPGSNPGAPALIDRELAVVVMAAGLGTRMKSAVPKHLHPILGRRVLDWVLEAARELEPAKTVLVLAPGFEALLDGVEVAIQEEPRG